MIRKTVVTLLASATLFAQPLAAQDEQDSTAKGEAVLAAIADKFNVEPLTAEQQARVPAAQVIVEKIMPPGTLNEVFGTMNKTLLGPIMQLAAEPTSADVAEAIGVSGDEINLDPARAAQAMAILDPAWKERRERGFAVTKETLSGIMVTMEPLMRKAMAETYAAHFSSGELADIDAFFSTPSGVAYARKSFAMATDPRIITASFQAMPEVMKSMADMEMKIAAATANLPAARGYDDLTAKERKHLVELTGLDETTLRDAMAPHPDEDAADTDVMVEDAVEG